MIILQQTIRSVVLAKSERQASLVANKNTKCQPDACQTNGDMGPQPNMYTEIIDRYFNKWVLSFSCATYITQWL